MKDALVICTRNRHADIKRCLDSLLQQRRMPLRLLVVDSSDSEDTADLSHQYKSEGGLPFLEYVHTAPGLTLQRNVALRTLQEDVEVVHFIDDDVELEPEYIEELMKAFEMDPTLVGAGGLIKGGNRKKARIVARLSGRDSIHPGRVLSTGFNIGAHETPFDVDVDWLPGCSMSFRLAMIDGLAFDERRVGYAIGEDADFGLRASARGKLRHVHAARLHHHQSPVNRHKRPLLVRMAVAHRWSLAEDNLGRVRRSMVVYGTLTESVTYLVRFLLSRSHDRLWWDCCVAGAAGLLDVTRRRA
ncbi:glycosyltransferase family 2 protein [Arthrobacter sp. Soil762]|uniref:glycosyltransferase family 2 protein n=1 Tax=Arthrobacter sp. Soil762 TaxID=1736401 RepID=UPI0009EB1D99|nr:glycosyltransferase family 2 protein [Arthrobacter sp. Soil762]